MRRERPRPSGTIRKARTPYRAIPLVLLMFSFLVHPAPVSAQTTWIFSQTDADGGAATSKVGDYTVINGDIEADPIEPGVKLDEIVAKEVGLVENPNDGGIAIDRFRNRIWATNGDMDNLRFVSMPFGPTADPTDIQIVEMADIAGSNPFAPSAANLDSITIMNGHNGRPKYLWVTSFNKYSYIDLRGDQWSWASESWFIPNGGFPVNDIAFGVCTLEVEPDSWVKYPAIYGLEETALITAWDPFHPDRPPLFTTGCGLRRPSGIAVDTSNPVSVLWDGRGRRHLSGRLLCFGELNGVSLIRDVDERHLYEVEVSRDDAFLGMVYSAETVNLMPFLGKESTGASVRVAQSNQTPGQPIVPLRDGERQMFRIETIGAENFAGMRAFFLAQMNTVGFLTSKNGDGPLIIDADAATLRRRGQLDPKSRSYVVAFDPEELPSGPLAVDSENFFYGQWVFLPPKVEHGIGKMPLDDFYVSDLVRIAISNGQ